MTILLDRTSSLIKGTAQSIDIAANPGQQGFVRNQAAWASSARYVKQRMLSFLISGPALAKYLPDAEFRLTMLRSLIEERATSIVGINGTVSVEYGETAEHINGEMRETPLRSLIERSVPTYEWPELFNKLINPYWEDYISMFVADAELGVPMVSMLESYRSDPNPLPLIEANQSFTVLYVEPSSDFRSVVNATLVTNHMPKSGGENTMTRSMSDAPESPVVSIEFTGMSDRSKTVMQMAQKRLDVMNSLTLDPVALASRPTYIDDIDPDVEKTGNGFFSAL